MSSDHATDQAADGHASDVPPLTEDIAPGTATDPSMGADAAATVTVDGVAVDVPAGATLLDAVEAVEDVGSEVSTTGGTAAEGETTAATVPALCHYGREDIGPRSTCRTCMVETESDGLVPACSHPAADGAVVRTDADAAVEARDVNLDLVLSNHNLRCTTCGKNGRCDLQDAAIENDVEEPRYGVFDDREAYEPVDDSSSFIQIDRNKCILCNRCVEACNDVQVEGVLRMEGSGGDTRIGFQNGAATMEDSTCVSCGHCATVCPTGALVEKGIENATTIKLPGFTQKNSVGKSYERSGTPKGPMTSKKGDERTERERASADERVRAVAKEADAVGTEGSDGDGGGGGGGDGGPDERRDWP